jgi:hypothetical protein
LCKSNATGSIRGESGERPSVLILPEEDIARFHSLTKRILRVPGGNELLMIVRTLDGEMVTVELLLRNLLLHKKMTHRNNLEAIFIIGVGYGI